LKASGKREIHPTANPGRLDFLLFKFLSLIFLSVSFRFWSAGKGADRKMWAEKCARSNIYLAF